MIEIMERVPGSDGKGCRWPDSVVELMWLRAATIDGEDPDVARTDVCGVRIHRDEYGQETTHGWEIDHIVPVAKGGTDSLNNLQALHWSENRKKGDTSPWHPPMC